MAAAFLFAACASNNAVSKDGPPRKNLHPGLTKRQVAAIYGPADDVRGGGEGETWIYYLNVGKQLVPWNLGHQPELRLIHFDRKGRLKSWSQTK